MRSGLSIRSKALALLVFVAAMPLGLSVSLLVGVNRRAVELAEARAQSAALTEVAGATQLLLERAQGDIDAIAAALAEAARSPSAEGDGLGVVRAVLATRRSVDAVRFEVPEAKVSTVLSREGSAGKVAESTEAERRRADERGVSLAIDQQGKVTLVVPIAMQTGGKGKRGYVTANPDIGALRETLEGVVARRFDTSGVRALVVDAERRVVSAAGKAPQRPGEATDRLPIWHTMPEGASFQNTISIVSKHDEAEGAMVGAIQTVPALGWAVAVWRPEREAYQALTEMRSRALLVSVASALFAIVAALVSSSALARPILFLVAQAKLIGQRRFGEVTIKRARGDELGELEDTLSLVTRDLESSEKELERQTKLRADLGRYLSKELVDKIVAGEHPLTLGGKRTSISVLFADVVAFTPLAETHPPEAVVALLNELFSLLSEIVFRHGGTVDKFIGDCIMAVWGAPTPCEDHAARALTAASDMMRFLETANEGWKERFGVEIRLAIGVNSGQALVGNVGSDKRMEYTAIGDTVNIAARLESIARPNQILVGEATHEMTEQEFDLTLLGEKVLTGRRETTKVYELAP